MQDYAEFKSAPLYKPLEPREGATALLIADGEGAEAILDLAKSASAEFWQDAHIIYMRMKSGETYLDQLAAIGANQFYHGPSFDAAEARIRKTFQDAKTGLQVYLAGSEGNIGLAYREAVAVGIPFSDIQREHRGPNARRMQCVHCKGITEDVTTDPFECSKCGLTLFVRDHYSRRYAAYQAVRVDAENPGDIPPIVEL